MTAVMTPLLVLLALLSWGFSSPVGSSPDDDYHLASIWCAQGERPGLCEQTGSPDTRLVPTPLTDFRCYTYYPDQSAACFDASTATLAETARFDGNNSYPPVFYATMSVFASHDVAASVASIRVFNAVLAVGLWVSVFWVLPRFARPAFIGTIAVTSVPLLLFLVPSTNPSSWALVSASMTWVCTWAAFRTSRWRQWLLTALVVLGALIGAGARADAAVFTVMAVGFGAVLGFRKSKQAIQWVPLGGVVVASIVAGFFYTRANQAGAVVNGLPSDTPPLTRRQLVDNLLGLPSLWQGAIGGPGWGLGWLDTQLPAVVPFVATLVLGGALFVNLRGIEFRRGLVISACGAALVVIPYILLAQTNAVVGTQVQPRYILPLMMILVGLFFAHPSALSRWTGLRYWSSVIALSMIASIALHVNLQRYTTGLDVQSLDPGSGAEWWWAGIPAPIIIWIIGSASFLGVFILLGWASTATSSPVLRHDGIRVDAQAAV